MVMNNSSFSGWFPYSSNSTLCPFTAEVEWPIIHHPYKMVYHLFHTRRSPESILPLPQGDAWSPCYATGGWAIVANFFVSATFFVACSVFTVLSVRRTGLSLSSDLRYDREAHRKLIFIFLALAGLIRMVYSAVVWAKIDRIYYTTDIAELSTLVVRTLLPVMSLSDWATAQVDIVMALFWFMLLSHRTTFPTTAFVAFSAVSFVALACCFVHDVLVYDDQPTLTPLYFWEYMFAYIGAVLLLGVMLHLITVMTFLYQALSTRDRVARANRLKSLTPAIMIMLCTFTTGTFRACVIFGRLSASPPFLSGTFSFNNSTFTFVYLTLIMQLPPVIVAVIVGFMTAREFIRDGQFGAALTSQSGEFVRYDDTKSEKENSSVNRFGSVCD